MGRYVAYFVSLCTVFGCAKGIDSPTVDTAVSAAAAGQSLMKAVVTDDLPGVRQALKHGANPNEPITFDEVKEGETITPLTAAVVLNRTAIAEELMNSGASSLYEFRGIRIDDFARANGSFGALAPHFRRSATSPAN